MMNRKLVSTCLVSGALLMPAVGYSADYGADKRSPAKDSSVAPAKESHGAFDDAKITAKIKSEYAKDKEVSAMRINVDTDKGVVTLGGSAKSKAEADKAVSIARGVTGVSSVNNQITVQAK